MECRQQIDHREVRSFLIDSVPVPGHMNLFFNNKITTNEKCLPVASRLLLSESEEKRVEEELHNMFLIRDNRVANQKYTEVSNGEFIAFPHLQPFIFRSFSESDI